MRLRLYERRRGHCGMHSVYAAIHANVVWVCARQRSMNTDFHG